MSKGSIHKRVGKHGGVSYLLKYDAPRGAGGERQQRYKTVRGTKREAEQELRRLLSEVDRGTHVDPSRLTVAAWIETWLTDHAAPTVSAKTLERYGELLRLHIAPRIGGTVIQRLTPPAIQSAYADLLKAGRRPKAGAAQLAAPSGLSARTVLHVHRVFFQCLATAVRQRVITVNPVADVTAPNPKRARADSAEPEGGTIRALDQGRLDALLRGLREHPLFPLAAVAAGTGMRRGEVLALRWSDIDLDGLKIRVERAIEDTKAGGVRVKNCPKNDSSRRTIGIDPGLASLLRLEWKRQAEAALALGTRLPAAALVFPAPPRGSEWRPADPRHPRGVTKEFTRVTAGIGFPRLRLHDLRHTHATLLLLAGVPVHAVAQRLGHSSPVTTMTVYAHVLQRAEDRAAEVSGEMLRSALSD